MLKSQTAFNWTKILYANDPAKRQKTERYIIDCQIFQESIPHSIELTYIAEKELILCTIALYHSQWTMIQTIAEKILQSMQIEKNQKHKSRTFFDLLIYYEIKFLLYLSKKRLGFQTDNFAAEELQKERNIDLTCPWIDECIKIENSAVFMGIGLYEECLLKLDSVDFKKLDDFWRMRLCTLKGTCWQALGNYNKSADAVMIQKEISERNESSLFQFTYARRQISLYIESENLLAANKIVDKFIFQAKNSASKVTYALFLQEQLRLAILEDNQ